EHPLEWEWDCEMVPAEVDPGHPLVAAALGAAADVTHDAGITGFDSWHDGATFTRVGGTPTVCFGPGRTETAHTVDEWVAEDDLVAFSQAVALLAMRWCGAGKE